MRFSPANVASLYSGKSPGSAAQPTIEAEAVEAFSSQGESASLPPESGCPLHTCTAGMRYRIDAAPPIHKPDRNWRLRMFRQ